jgi:hypothetical protein
LRFKSSSESDSCDGRFRYLENGGIFEVLSESGQASGYRKVSAVSKTAEYLKTVCCQDDRGKVLGVSAVLKTAEYLKQTFEPAIIVDLRWFPLS